MEGKNDDFRYVWESTEVGFDESIPVLVKVRVKCRKCGQYFGHRFHKDGLCLDCYVDGE